MKLKLLVAGLIVGVAGFAFQAYSASLPQNMTIDRTGRWIQNAAEASWFVWNNQLYYVYTDRDVAGSNTKTMKIVRFSDNATISTFGTGYGCMDAQVLNGTLYVIASSCNMDFTHKGNSVVTFTSTDLINFSQPTNLLTMNSTTQVYNVSVVKNTSTNEYVLSYETLGNYYNGFTEKFMKSTNLTNWTGTGNVIEGYGCADLVYTNAYYAYVCEAGAKHNIFGMKSNDLSTWNFSRLYTLKPTFEYEDINVSDPDIIEFNGKVYIMYSTGDQSTYFRLTYATYDGTLQQFVDSYQQPN